MNTVYNNLKESHYSVNYKGYEFVFSSNFHLEKFNREIDNYIENEKSRYSWKLAGLIVESDVIFALMFYKKVENRGFLVKKDDKELSKDYLLKIDIV